MSVKRWVESNWRSHLLYLFWCSVSFKNSHWDWFNENDQKVEKISSVKRNIQNHLRNGNLPKLQKDKTCSHKKNQIWGWKSSAQYQGPVNWWEIFKQMPTPITGSSCTISSNGYLDKKTSTVTSVKSKDRKELYTNGSNITRKWSKHLPKQLNRE